MPKGNRETMIDSRLGVLKGLSETGMAEAITLKIIATQMPHGICLASPVNI